MNPRTCVARVMPLAAKKIRACGWPATAVVAGRDLCARHAKVALKREAERSGRKESA